jgi:hypothetical protein
VNSHDSHLLTMVMQQVMTHLLHERSMMGCAICRFPPDPSQSAGRCVVERLNVLLDRLRPRQRLVLPLIGVLKPRGAH